MKINTYAVNCNDAWLNTEGDDISGSYVKYKDHQAVVSALEAKCAALATDNEKAMEAMRQADAAVKLAHEKFSALAAENAGLKNALEWLYETVSSESVSIPDEKYSPVTNAAQVLSETPTTDAFLVKVRAQGVGMVIAYHRERAEALHHVDRNNAIRHSMAALDASDVAAKLRQDANTAELVAAGIITKVGD